MKAIFLFPLLLAICTAAERAPADLPSGLQQAVEKTQTQRIDYAFDSELQTSRQHWRAHYDPGATPKLRLIEPRREELDAGTRRAFDANAKATKGVSWCASEGMSKVTDVHLLRDSGDTALYAFKPTPESLGGSRGARFLRHVRGEFILTKSDPDITAIHIYTEEPFSPFLLVRVDSFDVSIRCVEAPNGRRYAAEAVSAFKGSAFGRDIDEHSTQRTTNLSSP